MGKEKSEERYGMIKVNIITWGTDLYESLLACHIYFNNLIFFPIFLFLSF